MGIDYPRYDIVNLLNGMPLQRGGREGGGRGVRNSTGDHQENRDRRKALLPGECE